MSLSEVQITNDHGHGRQTKIVIDGVEQKGIYKAVLTASTDDVVRLETVRFAKIEVETRVVTTRTIEVQIVMADTDGETRIWVPLATGRGKTLRKAIKDAMGRIE